MRELTKKQKQILNQYNNIPNMEKLPYEVYEKVQKINDTELLWSQINNYLWENYLRKE